MGSADAPVEDVPAFTPAPKNRSLQLAFLLYLTLPQVLVWAVSEDAGAYTELLDLGSGVMRVANWQCWLQSEAFIVVLLCLSVERVCYTVVWLFPAHFAHFASRSPLRLIGSGQPLEAIITLFWVSKCFQFGSLFGWYFATGPLPSLAEVSLLRWVTGVQLLSMGQLLNAAIYRAIGKAGVYYGYKLGVPVPWCTGFPFNVFSMHPQYCGCVMTIFGAGVLMITERHAHAGFTGLGVAAAAYYVYMSVVEDIPAEHPLDQEPPSSPKKNFFPKRQLRNLRSLRWSMPNSESFDTLSNVAGFVARPWFAVVIAIVASINCFVLVLPVTVLFILACIPDSYSVLPNAATVASGYMLGVAALVTLLEMGHPIPGSKLNYAELQEHWPRTSTAMADHGLAMCLGAFVCTHPLPVVRFALAQRHTSALAILLSFVAITI